MARIDRAVNGLAELGVLAVLFYFLLKVIAVLLS
jgi:hypothetical protein